MNDAEVIVIGSGFGGSVVAARIAEAGFKVTTLERGPWRDTVPVRSMGIEKRSPLPRGRHLYGRLLRAVGGNWIPGGGRVKLSKHGLFELFFAKGCSIACSSGVGGGSHVYSAINVKPLAENYWEGHTDDISDASMSRHYTAVLNRMGSVTPMADHRIPNTSVVRFKNSDAIEPAIPPPDPRIGYLLPDDPDNPQKITDDNGIERYEVDYQSGEDGFLGSPKGSKTTLDCVYLAPAMKHGLTVRDMAEVTTITHQPNGGYRVEFIDHHTGREAALTADNVIVAAGTLNTLRILLRSREAGGLTGMPRLGERFGTNGDYFGYWDYNDKSVDQTVGLPTTGGVKLKGDDTSPLIGGGGLPAVDSYPLPKWVKARMKRAYMIAGLGEDNMTGRATFKKGRLQIDYNPDDSPIFARLRSTFAEIAQKTGYKIYAPKTPITVHPTGGACLGRSIDEGVIDSNGEVFDHPGLYVTDAAALPRAPGGPPSMTIAAWANHVATRFIERHARA